MIYVYGSLQNTIFSLWVFLSLPQIAVIQKDLWTNAEKNEFSKFELFHQKEKVICFSKSLQEQCINKI